MTAVAFNGFYIQDAGDGNNLTSDGIFVFTFSASVSVGDEVRVEGTVAEFIPRGAGTGNLSITQIFAGTITIVSSGNPRPAPIIIGLGGRIPPTHRNCHQ